MVVLLRTAFLLAAIVVLTTGGVASAQEGSPTLSKDEEKLLESLVRDFLFDPKEAERVRVVITPRSPWQPHEVAQEGWLVKAESGDRIYFTDGDTIPAPHKSRITKVPFLAQCAERYDSAADAEERVVVFGGRMMKGGGVPRPSGRWDDEPALVLAAWLHRLGEKHLAAQVMRHASKDRWEDAEVLRRWLAHAAFGSMAECFANYQDRRAFEHGERLLRLYPMEARDIAHAEPLIKDLCRRKQEGKLGKKARQDLPKGFNPWPTEKRLRFLIETLDETEAGSREIAYRLEEVPRLAALVNLGEAAVPMLLDVLEKDTRLTRCVHGAHTFEGLQVDGLHGNNYHLETVHDVAQAALSKILRIDHFWTRQAEYPGIAVAARAYWTEFGPLAFEERMMRVLNDPFSSVAALRESAWNLPSEIDRHESWRPLAVSCGPPAPALLRFEEPTAAQAVLRAMDRVLISTEDQTDPRRREENRADDAAWFLAALIRIGDKRIADELSSRADTESDAPMRLWLAHAAHRLGQSQELRSFADAFAAGKVKLGVQADGGPSRSQLNGIVEYLAAVDLPEADRALFALTEPDHPCHAALLDGMIEGEGPSRIQNIVAHRSCARLIRKLLDDGSLTGITCSTNGRQENRQGPNWGRGGGAPAILADPKKRKSEAKLRRCDVAGELAEGFAGLPEFHPLLNDADDRLAIMRDVFRRFDGRWRKLSDLEMEILNGLVRYGPDLAPLGRPASKEDVKGGKAIFHLDGKGKLADVSLPARGTLKGIKDESLRNCLIVQAEVQPDGQIVYGIVHCHAIRKAMAGEITDVTPLTELRAQQKSVAQQQRLAEQARATAEFRRLPERALELLESLLPQPPARLHWERVHGGIGP